MKSSFTWKTGYLNLPSNMVGRRNIHGLYPWKRLPDCGEDRGQLKPQNIIGNGAADQCWPFLPLELFFLCAAGFLRDDDLYCGFFIGTFFPPESFFVFW